jgi:hypothetical protein
MRQKLQVLSLCLLQRYAEVHDLGLHLNLDSFHTKYMLLLKRHTERLEAICANASPFQEKHFTKNVFLTVGQ